MTEEYGNLPDGFFLSQEEVESMRKAKKELTQYGKQKLGELMETEQPFYRFFAVDYFATGEGRSYWMMICRNYPFIGDKDRQKDKFVNFVGMGAEYYMHGFEELTEEEFMKRYDALIPEHVKVQIHRRDQPMFTWQQHLHVNYS